jgi:hypothetical protein
MSNLLIWTGIFAVLGAAFLAVLWKEKDRKLFLLYFVFGMAFGLYFDAVSVAQGYYTYPELFINLSGVPLTMAIAEGFSVAITIKIFEAGKRLTKGFTKA